MAMTDEEQRLLAADDLEIVRSGYWLVAIATSFGSAVAVIAVQSVYWLKHGEWPAFTVARLLSWLGFHVASVNWTGVQRILRWLLDCPVAGALLAVGSTLILLFTRHDRSPVPEALRTARRKRAQRAEGSKG